MSHNSVDLTLEHFKLVIEALELRLEIVMDTSYDTLDTKLNEVFELLNVREVFRQALSQGHE